MAAPAASRELHLAQARALVSEDTSKWVRGAMLRVGDALTANLAPGSPVVTLTALDRASQRAMTVRESGISCETFVHATHSLPVSNSSLWGLSVNVKGMRNVVESRNLDR